MDKKIILYTTHCPKCEILEQKLKEKNIEYETCTDIDLMLEKGFMSSPILEVDSLTLEFVDAIYWIKEN